MFDIRQAQFADAAAISSLVIASAKRHLIPSLNSEGSRQLVSKMDLASVESYFEEGYQFLLAENSNQTPPETLGVAAIKPPAHLFYLFVDNQHHRQGIGKALWQVVRESLVLEQGHSRITVNSSPNAVSFYQQLGFEPVGEMVTRNEVQFQPMIWECSR